MFAHLLEFKTMKYINILLLCLLVSCVFTQTIEEQIELPIVTKSEIKDSTIVNFYIKQNDYKACKMTGWNVDSLYVLLNAAKLDCPKTEYNQHICLLSTKIPYDPVINFMVTDNHNYKTFRLNIPKKDTVYLYGNINTPIEFDVSVNDWNYE